MGLGNRAVSHWAAKDATLSLQGHRSEPQAAWDRDRIKAASGHKLTDYFSSWHHSSDSCPNIPRESRVCSILIMWHRKLLMSLVTPPQMLPCVCAHSLHLFKYSKMSLKLIGLCIWPTQNNKTTSLESSFNRSDQLKWYCFHSPYSLFDPNSINPLTNEATWIGVILNQIII